jgi:hypothetical protein
MRRPIKTTVTTAIVTPATTTQPATTETQAVVKKTPKAKVEKVKAEKPVKEVKVKAEIIIKDLKLPKAVEIKECKTCSVITNANGNKWYLKGKTLQITQPLADLNDRIEKFPKEVIEKGHLGKVTCFIKVTDTADLQTILDSFKDSAGPEKKAKVEKPAKTKKVKADKATKTEETPAVTEAEIPATTETQPQA